MPAIQLRDKANKLEAVEGQIKRLQRQLRQECMAAQEHRDKADSIQLAHAKKEEEQARLQEELRDLKVDIHGMSLPLTPPPTAQGP